MKEKLLSRIAERKITVGVVGLGYVGLPPCRRGSRGRFQDYRLRRAGRKSETGECRTQLYRRCGRCEKLAQLVRNGTLSATSDFSFIKDVDFVAICVPTPLDVHQEPDISYVESFRRNR